MIHLTVTDAIDKCQVAGASLPSMLRDLFTTVKAIVTYVKQSSVQAILHARADGKGLIQSVMTRWNTDLDMIERFLELITEQPSSPTLPTVEDIRVLKEVVVILKPFKVNIN